MIPLNRLLAVRFYDLAQFLSKFGLVPTRPDALPVRRPRLQCAATAGRAAATAPAWRVARRRRLPRRAPRRLAAALLIRRAGKHPGGPRPYALHAYCMYTACAPACAHIHMQSKCTRNANASCTHTAPPVGVGHGERLRTRLRRRDGVARHGCTRQPPARRPARAHAWSGRRHHRRRHHAGMCSPAWPWPWPSLLP